MADKPPVNWARLGKVWLPIGSLADSWNQPVVLTDETQTIVWFSAKASKDPAKHREHRRDADGAFEFTYKGEQQHPAMVERDVAPAYWSPAVVVEG